MSSDPAAEEPLGPQRDAEALTIITRSLLSNRTEQAFDQIAGSHAPRFPVLNKNRECNQLVLNPIFVK